MPKPRVLQSDVQVGNTVVHPGQRARIELPAARLPTQTQLSLPVEVVNGTQPGPRLWLSAAIHGDELNGMEIIHRVLGDLDPDKLKGEIIAAPIVNVFGFVQQDRYLPDRRDLNRSFPGSPNGSLAARLAHLFMTQIVGKSTHGIDLHTASLHRVNMPQVRGNLADRETRRIAHAFNAPIMIQGEAPRGSLRAAVARKRIPIIVYEAGEPHRFNEDAIEAGTRGVKRVMAELGMTRKPAGYAKVEPSIVARDKTWVRARRSGILRLQVTLGQVVERYDTLGVIHDAFGEETVEIKAPAGGMVIGFTNHPLVNQGDAILHLARRLTEDGK